MKIEIHQKLRPDSLGFTHRLHLDNYFQDLTAADLKRLAEVAKEAVRRAKAEGP